MCAPMTEVAAAQPARVVPDRARPPTRSSTPTPDEPHGRLPVHEVHGLGHGRRHGRRAVVVASHEARRRARRARRPARCTCAAGATRPTRSTSPSTPTCGGRRRWRRRAPRRSRGAGVGIDDVAHLDLYSCFAVSVHFARDALGHRAPTTPRPLTVTGGLPYHGGAGQRLPHALDRDDGRACCAPTRARSGSSAASACT